VLVAGTTRWTDRHTTPETNAISKTVDALFPQGGPEPLVVDLRQAPGKGWRVGRRDEYLSRVASLVAAINRTDKDEVFGEHIRAQRRAIVGLTAALTLIASLAIVAFAQFRLADRRLTQAVSVARHIHEALDERLALVAGAASIRRDLLEASAQLLNELIGQTPESESEVRLHRLGAYIRRGRLAFDNEALALAAREFDAAIDLASRYQSSVEREWPWARHVAEARVGRGDVFEAAGDLANAFNEFTSARDTLAAFEGGDTDPTLWRRRMSQTLDRLHAVHKARGNLEQASSTVREALALDLELVNQAPDDVMSRSNLAVSYMHAADVDLARNDLPGAATGYDAARASLERLMADNPANAMLEDSWVEAVAGLATVHFYDGRRDEAATWYERARARVASLVEREPTTLYWQRLLASTLTNIGATYAAAGEQPTAVSLYRDAVSILDALLLRDDDNTLLLRQRADLEINVGDLAWDHSDYQTALTHYERASARFQQLQQRDPNNSDWALSRATSLERLGNTWLGRGDFARAEGYYKERQNLVDDFLKTYPTSWDWLFAQAGGLIKLAEVAEARQELTAASKFVVAIGILDGLRLRDSQNLVSLSVLGYALNGLGQTLLATESLDEALVNLQRSRSIHLELLSRDSDNVDWAAQFVEAVARIAQIQITKKAYRDAQTSLDECTRVANWLQESQPRTVPALAAMSACQSRIALLSAWRDEASWIAEHTELTIQRAQIAALAPEDLARTEEFEQAREVLVTALAGASAAEVDAVSRRLRQVASALQPTLPAAAAMLRSIR
jgi:tetratricopeptide (TPR) repeat protein